MSRRPPGGAGTPFDAIAEALEEPAGRASFVRGLTLGALVGAAVVGSLLRARRGRSARGGVVADPGSSSEASASGDMAAGVSGGPAATGGP